MAALDRIDTIIVVIMENRSFDHMLGYLSHPLYGNRHDVDGQKTDPEWLSRYTNRYQGKEYAPYRMTELPLRGDPPHERRDIRVQIGDVYPWADKEAPMNGFVASYASNPRVPAGAYSEVMGFYTPQEAPITGFLADNFVICDRWFASLPTSTQPNRLMAMGGFTLTDNTFSSTVPDQDLVYDWCGRQSRKVSWRVYHEGWPFFMVMNRWRIEILKEAIVQDRFRSLDHLEDDFASSDPFPQLVFVEPKYTDDHFSLPEPSDDHPPTSIAGGQSFLLRVYSAMLRNPERFKRTLMIVTYDENGGFFDHVSPQPVPTKAPDYSYRPFTTTGVRVPAFVVSPLVAAGKTFSGVLDHTSILKLIGKKFGDGGKYLPMIDGKPSLVVEDRPLVGNVSDVLEQFILENPRQCPPPPAYTPQRFAHAPADRVASPMSQAFEHALVAMRNEQPEEAARKFPELAGYFTSHEGALALLAHRELLAKGLMLAGECESAFDSFIERADARLQKDLAREYLAVGNLTQLINLMAAEVKADKLVTLENFQKATRAMPVWPFI